MKILLLILSSIFNLSSVYAANIILHYEPAIIELTGIIEHQTFLGPPNFESIANDDAIEKGWYLRLVQPVDVLKSKNDAPSAMSETERNVKIMQLAFVDDNLVAAIIGATKLRKKVRLKGYLFHSWSGHHHSRVLMFVHTLEEINS